MDGEEIKEQKLRILALTSKELKIKADQSNLGNYTVKQVAYAIAGSLSCILPSDLLELGGETDRCA